MQSTQITLRNVRQSPAFSRRIREKCEALERFHPHLSHCRVSVERASATTAHQPFQVTIRLGIPGGEIVVSHTHHLDPHLAVRDAFNAARRQLKDAAEIARGDAARPQEEDDEK